VRPNTSDVVVLMLNMRKRTKFYKHPVIEALLGWFGENEKQVKIQVNQYFPTVLYAWQN